MSVGITRSVAALGALGEMVSDVIEVVRHGIGIGSLPKLLEVLADVETVVEDARVMLPELEDLDVAEAGQLAAAAYVQVKRIVSAFAV